MSAVRTYLDHNATSPLRPEAREEMMRALDVSGNASSVHAEGRTARALIEAARTKIAALAGAAPRDVVFTSGATEAANWVMAQPWQVVLVSAVEHAAVMAPALRCGARVEIIPVDGAGRVDPEGLGELIDAVCGDGGVSVAGAVLVAVQHANNESGVVQPIAKIAEIARERGVRLIVDAVQAAGRVALDQRGQGIDFMVLSSHKIGGPQGAGALVIGNEASIDPMLVGGGQERSLRAGTENVAAIAGFGAAAAASERDLARSAHLAR
ncbi:MAG TPA: aminotransferase class V-fold PLP-dependent enzyme, partial [Hyphomicrobiaceae bacterium]|nr:aminotransferase class V-fold PLP-dependent enzyme [Hyphomicrobiaceae bacterium]